MTHPGTFETFDDLRRQIFAWHKAGAYRQAAEAIAMHLPRFPETADMLRFWQMCFHALDGQPDDALLILSRVVTEGGFFGRDMLSDSDLMSLHGHPEFERLGKINDDQFTSAQALVQPYAHLAASIDPPRDLLVVLHGNDSNIALHLPHWEPALQHQTILLMPQSSQLSTPDRFVWDDHQTALDEITSHIQRVQRDSLSGTEELILAGFSKGAHIASLLALSRKFSVQGLILVSGTLPNAEQHTDDIKAAIRQGLRAAFFISQRDIALPRIEAFSQVLEAQEMPVWSRRYPEMGHAYPNDFSATLPDVLAFIRGDE